MLFKIEKYGLLSLFGHGSIYFLLIKKFLETDYPRGRALEVFRWFHFDLKAKSRNFVFCPTRNCEKAIPTSPKGRYYRKPRGRAIGEF